MRQRNRVLNVRMSDEEMEMVAFISESTGLSVADVVRQLIRREHGKLKGVEATLSGRKRR